MTVLTSLLFSILLTQTSSTKLIKFEKQEDVFQFRFIKNLFDEYNTFQIIFHVDNSTSKNINNFLRIYNSNSSPWLILNHDLNHTLERPIRSNFLHVVSLQTQFTKILQTGYNVLECDVVIFLLTKSRLEFFTEKNSLMSQLDRAGNILVVDLSHKKNFDFYRLSNRRLVKIQKGTQVLLQKKIENFNGLSLKIGYNDYYPYAYREKKTTRISGIEARLVKLLSQKLNFTVKFSKINSSFEEFIQKFDFVIGGFSLNLNYFNQVRFSSSICFENVVAIYFYDSSLSFALSTFFLPFPALVWFGIALILIGMTFLAHFISKTPKKTVFKVSQKWDKLKLLLHKFFQLFLKILIEQPTKIHFRRLKLRFSFILFLSTWFLFCLLIDTSYKSRLASILMKPPLRQSFDLKQLINNGYLIVADDFSRDKFLKYTGVKSVKIFKKK